MLPSASATQKSSAPPPKPPEAKPAAQLKPADPAPAQQPSKPAPDGPEKAPAQGQPQGDPGSSSRVTPAQPPDTGYRAAGIQDGFQRPQAAQAAPRAQGDTFEAQAPAQSTLDQKSGGGLGDTLLDAAKTVAAPIAEAVAPVVAPVVDAAKTVGSAIGSAIAPAIDHLGHLWDNKETMAKLADIGQPGVIGDVLNPPDKTKPTEGMTDEQRKAYDALPPDQRQRYDDLHEQAAETWKYRTVGPEATTVTPSSAVNNLRGMLTSGNLEKYLKVEDALKGPDQATHLQDVRELLFQGKLADGKVSRDGATTLDAMADLAKGGTTQVGVDRTKLLGQLAHDINHPEQIKQGERNADCGGSTAAFVMALTQPAEYARMIQGLGEKGQVELTPEWAKLFGAKSNVMKLNAPFDPADQRSVTQQLFAKTFDQEAVNGQQPVTAPPAQAAAAAAAGITGQQLKDGLNDKGILGGGWDAVYLPPAKDPNNPNDKVTDAQRAEATKVAEDMIDGASPRKPVMVNVDNHWVTVLGHDKDGKYWVKDPMSGTVSQVSRDDLTKGLNSVVYQDRNFEGQVPDYMHNAEWAKPGGGGPTSGGTGSSGGSSGGGSTR